MYWLQPPGGDVSTQIPAMKLEDGFYSLSLRMMKAIWRHVRLKKDFINVERAQMGGLKLRIPSMLLNEKIRTKTRFNVSACECMLCVSCLNKTRFNVSACECMLCVSCSKSCALYLNWRVGRPYVCKGALRVRATPLTRVPRARSPR